MNCIIISSGNARSKCLEIAIPNFTGKLREPLRRMLKVPYMSAMIPGEYRLVGTGTNVCSIIIVGRNGIVLAEVTTKEWDADNIVWRILVIDCVWNVISETLSSIVSQSDS